MTISPPPIYIDKYEGFTEENDIFKLKPFGERLALIVEQNDDPAVVAIDGEWGSGKSVFAKQWAGLLRQRKIPVIEFDAFANDYHEDAFIALASEIIAYAKTVRNGEEDGVIKTFIDTTVKVGRVLAPVLAKLGIKAATFGLIGSDTSSDAMKKLTEAIASDTGTVLEKELADRLNKAESTAAMMKSFGAALGELAAKLAQWEKPDAKAEDVKPRLVVIIDELDRCKPSFALDLLEKIKHFYDVNGVSFVLVTNLRQIEAAVKGRYGADTDATTYLQKFITIKFRWNPRSEENQPLSVPYSSLYKVNYQELHEEHISVLKFFSHRVNLSLRSVERIYSYISIYPGIMIFDKEDKSVHLGNIIILLICLRESGINYDNDRNDSKFRDDTVNLLFSKSTHGDFEKLMKSYIDVLTVKDDIKLNAQCRSIVLSTGERDVGGLQRRIIRLLSGEAVG